MPGKDNITSTIAPCAAAPASSWDDCLRPSEVTSVVTPCVGAIASTFREMYAPEWVQVVNDTFTDVHGTVLQDHAATPLGGAWLSDAVWRIQFNGGTYDRNTLTPVMAYAQMATDRGDDNIRVTLGCFRGNDDPFIAPYQEIGGVTFLQKTNDLSNGEGCMVFFKSISAAQVELWFQRRGPTGAIQQQVLLDTLNVNPNSSAGTIRATVVGLQVTVERNGVPYAPITLTADLRDGTHRRVGLCALTGDPSGRYFLDNLIVEVAA